MFRNPFPKLRRICAKSIVRRFFAFSLLVAVCVYGADKELGWGVNRAMARGLRAVANAGAWCFSVVEQAVGYALTEVGEGEEHDLTMPGGADMADAIAARGAFEDSVMVGDEVLVRTDGKIERNKTAFMVRPGEYGFLPGFRWEEQNNVPLCDCENLLMSDCENVKFV